MPRKRRSDGDATSQFLLPFEEVPRCFASGKGRPAIDSAEEYEPLSTDAVEKQEKRKYFDSFTLERTTDAIMPDGPTEKNPSGRFLIKVGQHVLLRPEENSLRPGVGKVIAVYKEKGKEDVAIRARWYYRGEDLTEGPTEAVGEDEVFETQHFEDIDADSVAGRCQVLSYRDWIVLADAKRRSSAVLLKAKYAETLRRDNVLSQVQTRSNGLVDGKSNIEEDEDVLRSRNLLKAKFAEAVRGDNILTEAQTRSDDYDDDGKSDVEEKEDVMDVHNEEGMRQLGNAYNEQNGSRNASPELDVDSIDKPLSTAEDREVKGDSDNDDIISTFHANYPESSVLYYCRRFYDPLSNTFLVSKHEDENADPVQEIIALRAGRERESKNGDGEFREDELDHSSSDEDYDISADESERNSHRPKRRRALGGQNSVRKRERAPSASQFSLPQDLGVPSSLPCRDSQKAHVHKFLLGAIKGSAADGQGGSRCLYISGVPGTGKTATVREVLRDLIAKRSAGSLPPFEVVEVNAMSLPDPNLVYAELYAALTGNRNVTPMHAAQLLEKRFATDAGSSSRKPKRAKGPQRIGQDSCTILILDEMDVLLARKQKVLYDMLEWPTRKDARMAVIGIANTMDLPERILPRIGSRLGLNRLSYPPYTSSQLETILQMTLDETRVEFSKPAIQLCVKKVGSVSGDVRRALELCRRACEILLDGLGDGDEGEKPVVTADQMQAAIQDVAGGARLVALNQLSLFEKLVVGSAISLARREGSSTVEKSCSMAAVTAEAIRLTRAKQLVEEVDTPSIQELEEACWRLASSRIVIVEANAVPRNSRIVVNVSTEDCLFALRECSVMTALLEASEAS